MEPRFDMRITDPFGRCGPVCRVLLRLLVFGLIVWLVHWLLIWVPDLRLFENDRLRIGILFAVLIAYAILIALPFVPGIEIGLSLMVMEGPSLAPLLYVSTVLGLSLAYAAGEWVPYSRLHRVFADLRLNRLCRLLEKIEPLDRAQRIEALRDRLPKTLRPLASRYRYLMLALLVNLPGNAVIGGGGGIFFTAGLSRLFLPVQTSVTILIAVAPVPVAVWVFNIDIGAFLN